MLHSIIFGVLLGFGAAIPLGPMNIEIIRRNLTLGTLYGFLFGLGACTTDLFFLIILSLGALNLLTHVIVLKIVGILGSLIIGWFGYSALKLKVSATHHEKSLSTKKLKHYQHYFQGFLMTFVNPFTILFWASVSSQVAGLVHKASGSLFGAGLGVMIGTVSWVVALNSVLHLTRHKFSANVMQRLNVIGGVILLCFAIVGLIHFVI